MRHYTRALVIADVALLDGRYHELRISERLTVKLGAHENSTKSRISGPRAILTPRWLALSLRPARSRSTLRAGPEGSSRRSPAIANQPAGLPDYCQSAKPSRQPDHLEIFRKLRFSARHRQGRRGSARRRPDPRRI